jgi:hypothetical protein
MQRLHSNFAAKFHPSHFCQYSKGERSLKGFPYENGRWYAAQKRTETSLLPTFKGKLKRKGHVVYNRKVSRIDVQGAVTSDAKNYGIELQTWGSETGEQENIFTYLPSNISGPLISYPIENNSNDHPFHEWSRSSLIKGKKLFVISSKDRHYGKWTNEKKQKNWKRVKRNQPNKVYSSRPKTTYDTWENAAEKVASDYQEILTSASFLELLLSLELFPPWLSPASSPSAGRGDGGQQQQQEMFCRVDCKCLFGQQTRTSLIACLTPENGNWLALKCMKARVQTLVLLSYVFSKPIKYGWGGKQTSSNNRLQAWSQIGTKRMRMKSQCSTLLVINYSRHPQSFHHTLLPKNTWRTFPTVLPC